jgi:hypothetical protein
MMEKYQKPTYKGTLREAGREEDKKRLEKISYQRSGERLE